MYRFYVEWIFVQRNERGFSKKKKKEKKKKRNTMSRKNKDVEYKNKICNLALDNMLDHKHSACTNAIHS